MSAAVEPSAPNSCCTRPTPHEVRGVTRTSPKAPAPASNVRASSAPVTAASTPIDVPDGRRPVSLAAPRIVVEVGRST